MRNRDIIVRVNVRFIREIHHWKEASGNGGIADNENVLASNKRETRISALQSPFFDSKIVKQ